MPSSSSELAAAAVAGRAPRLIRADAWGRLPVWLPRRSADRAGGRVAGVLHLADPNPLQFASPADTAKAFWEGWSDGSLAGATEATLRILGVGMLIGTAVAAVLTAVATWSRVGDDLLVLLTAMINPIPAIAMLPLAILWFGLDTDALVFVIANAALANRHQPQHGVQDRQPDHRRRRPEHRPVGPPARDRRACAGRAAARALGPEDGVGVRLEDDHRRRAGLRRGRQQGGLGWRINDARFFLDTPSMFASLVTIMLIGIALDLVFALVERWTVVRWGMKAAQTRTARVGTV